MATASVELSEYNTAGESVTNGISNINFGSTDAANIVVANYPITVGVHSFTKYIKFHVSAINDSNQIDNIRIWKSNGDYLTDEVIKTNLTESSYTSVSFATPATASYSGNNMPTSEPSGANLGIAGSLTNALSAAGYSDYWKLQLQTGAGTPPGDANQKTFTFKYDEQ